MTESLEERVRSPGFTPRAREVAPLLALLSSADDELAKDIERGLSRLGPLAVKEALEQFPSSTPPLRSRLCAVVGRVAAARPEPSLVTWLIAALHDPDPKTRRRAGRDLGKLDDPRIEGALLEAFRDEVPIPDLRALAMSLGNVGAELARARLSKVQTADAELARVIAEAVAKIERRHVRRDPGSIDASRAPERPTPVLLHVRAGLEEILQAELGDQVRSRIAGRGRVEVALEGPLEGLFRARTFVDVGFPLAPEPVLGGDVTSAAARAIGSDAAFRIFSAFTTGPVRYRLEWSTGKRRGATWKVATQVAALRSELVNDPEAALWQVVVTDRSAEGGRLFVELWPQALADPRFAYRRRTLPASSHPTIAAALARVGGVIGTDVVWDPFVGAAGELVERALLGPYVRLFGTDTDPRALEAARENLKAASVERHDLFLGDARTQRLPERPTLILTNPPFGKRVLDTSAVGPLLEATLAHVASLMAPGGRLVWLSPNAQLTESAARRHGFSVRLRRDVDVAGARAELQAFVLGAKR